MVNIRTSFFFLILLLLITPLVQAEVSSTIDRNPVRVNETFELTLHMESAPVSRPPLTGLPEEFEIVRSTNFYQRSTVNGKTEIQAGWRFILRASKEGVFTIPRFEIDGQNTQLFQLKVLPPVSTTSIGGQVDAIRLTAIADSDEVYVQQQILFTIRLYRAVQAQYASLTDPEMPGALLERLGEDRQFETEIEGVRFIVLERRYVIFPQESGTHAISSVTFTAEVSDGTRKYSTIGRLRARTKAVSLSTEAVQIHVKNRPTNQTAWWLPAENVSITEQWHPEPTVFRVGEPVTWNYFIKAEGLTSTQLPELLPETTDGLKFYPDKALSENQMNEKGITGIRSQKVAVVPTRAGILTLPELKLFWWNINENKSQVISLPIRTIEVLPSLDGNYGVKPTPKQPVTETITNTNERVDESPETKKLNIQQWKMIALVSLLLWLITALLLFLRKTLPAKQVKKKKIVTLAPRKTLQDIAKSCKQNSAEETQSAIIEWCLDQQQLHSVRSLSQLSRNIKDVELIEQLKILERSLYGSTDTSWSGDALLPLIKSLPRSIKQQSDATKSAQLPPLHLTEK